MRTAYQNSIGGYSCFLQVVLSNLVGIQMQIKAAVAECIGCQLFPFVFRTNCLPSDKLDAVQLILSALIADPAVLLAMSPGKVLILSPKDQLWNLYRLVVFI